TNHQLRYSRALVGEGRVDEARAILDETLARLPDSLDVWSELANLELRRDGREAAAKVLRRALDEHGNNGWALWRITTLDGEIPLLGIMPDGYAEAMAEVGRVEVDDESDAEDVAILRAGDEAYYVVDFAARQYYPDGSQLTLTHTVVRVMTRGAIDRFGETEIPGNARLLLARTIKQDGTILAPEEVSGKSTLSMPSLAEGDLVEIAYLQYGGRGEVSSHIEDLRFYFRMSDISTRHSEYVVLGAPGMEFMRMNDAPEIEPIEFDGVQGVRFVAYDNPRPRQEPFTTSGFEYLPWVQGYRSGVELDMFEAQRRYVADNVRDSVRGSSYIDAQISEWLGRAVDEKTVDEKGATNQDVVDLFYAVTSLIPSPSLTSFGTEASHALLGRRGSTLILLKTVYDRLGIDSEIYLVKSQQQIPEVYPVEEFSKYRRALLRVELPTADAGTGEKTVWLEPGGPDASFGVFGGDLYGQPASCVSCIKDEQVTVPELDPASRHILVEGRLT
ncbi:MAG: tetratricopeptide repeat protein, partial [Bradymonadaceae bacterium]